MRQTLSQSRSVRERGGWVNGCTRRFVRGWLSGESCGISGERRVAPARSSAARAALRSTRLLLHLFPASHACTIARDRLVGPTQYRGEHQVVARPRLRNNWPETDVGAALCCEAPRGRRSISAAPSNPRHTPRTPSKYQPFSAGAELSSNGLLLRRWLRSSRGVAPKKLR